MQNKNNLELDVREMFDVKKNDDAKRFEFNSKGEWISYTIHFNECEEDIHNAWISIYKALKHDSQLSPDNYVNASTMTHNARALRRQGIELQMFGLITKSKIELQWMK